MFTVICRDGYGNSFTVARGNDFATLNRYALKCNGRYARYLNALGHINRSMRDSERRYDPDPRYWRAFHVVETLVLV